MVFPGAVRHGDWEPVGRNPGEHDASARRRVCRSAWGDGMKAAGRRRVRTKSVQGFEAGDSLSRPSSFAPRVGSWRAV